jgi:hypothetical protein
MTFTYLPTLSRPLSVSFKRKDKFKLGLLSPLQSPDALPFLFGVPRIRGGVFHFFLNSKACALVIGPAKARTSTRGLIGSTFNFL